MAGRDELSRWLVELDANERRDRLARLQLLVDEFLGGEHVLFAGGELALRTFEEARRAYLFGLDIGTVLLVQAWFDHTLRRSLLDTASDSDVYRYGFKRLLEEARRHDVLTADEYGAAEALRSKARNPYSHSREPLAVDSMERRAIETGESIEAISESDAHESIRLLLRIVSRAPYGLRRRVSEQNQS